MSGPSSKIDKELRRLDRSLVNRFSMRDNCRNAAHVRSLRLAIQSALICVRQDDCVHAQYWVDMISNLALERQMVIDKCVDEALPSLASTGYAHINRETRRFP